MIFVNFFLAKREFLRFSIGMISHLFCSRKRITNNPNEQIDENHGDDYHVGKEEQRTEYRSVHEEGMQIKMTHEHEKQSDK